MKLFLGNAQDVEIDVDEIHVYPIAAACGGVWDIIAKKAWVSKYWTGIESGMKYFYYTTSKQRTECYTMKDAENAARDHYNANNENSCNSVIPIKVSDIDENVMKHFRYVQPEIDYPFQEVPIDGYFLGIWLCGGKKTTSGITNVDAPIIKYLYDHATSLDMKVRKMDETEYFTYKDDTSNPLMDNLRALDLFAEKRIPKIYLENTVEIRLSVLSAILDVSGYLDVNVYDISQKSDTLAADIVSLATSLGFFCRLNEKISFDANTEKKRVNNRIHIYPNYNTPKLPMLIGMKKLNTNGIVFNGIKFALKKTKTTHKQEWTTEMKDQLKATILKYTVGKRVQWTKLVANEDLYKLVSVDAMRQRGSGN